MGENFLNENFPEKTVRYPDPDCKAYLLLTFDGSSAEIEAAVEKLGQIVKGVSRSVDRKSVV